jgi:isoleucyl-tRNA synthetase
MLEKYGADVLRYWLYTVNQPGESKNFDERTVGEVVKRVFGILENVVRFYELYASDSRPTIPTPHGVGTLTANVGADNPDAPRGRDSDRKRRSRQPTSGNMLDRWILARLQQLTADATTSLDAFQVFEPARAIRDFVTDFSTWYIRRSRERFKANPASRDARLAEGEFRGDGESDKQSALATTRYVLLELAKLMAPFTPFIAEDIYRSVGGPLESVHLEAWPAPRFTLHDSRIIEEMAEVRRIVSLALESRMTAGIKVRQPLSTLRVRNIESRIKNNEELVQLIKDEVNVKDVVFEDATGWEVELDTEITPELKAEGEKRELIRAIQNLRKETGLMPKDVVVLEVSTDSAGQELIEMFRDELQKSTLLRDIQFTHVAGEQVVVDDMTFTMGLKK